MKISPESLAQMIDHTLLKPEATAQEIENLCAEAKNNRFYAVCVNPYFVATAEGFLKDTGVQLASVIGFPLGAATTDAKVFEAKQAIHDGATELDMVLNIGEVKSGNFDAVENEIRQIVMVNSAVPVKVILETCLLTMDEIVRACKAAKAAGAAFVKTSTGFSKEGAKPEIVSAMRKTVGTEMGVKASGGIRSYESALLMVEAGANRLGTSSGVKILQEAKRAG